MSRRGRHRPWNRRIVPTEAALEVLKSDYPEAVKQRAYLAAHGALHGRRGCILCGQPGCTSRVYIPPDALRVDDPDYSEVTCYLLCLAHQTLDGGDEQVIEALKTPARPPGKRHGEGKEAEAQRYEQGNTP